MPADTSETSRCKLSCSFGVLVVVMGLGFVALAFVLLLAAFRDNRPDAGVFMHKTIAMTIPIILVGVGIALTGLYQVCRRGDRRAKKKMRQVRYWQDR